MDTNLTAAPPIADLPSEMLGADLSPETPGNNPETAATNVPNREPGSITLNADDRLLVIQYQTA